MQQLFEQGEEVEQKEHVEQSWEWSGLGVLADDQNEKVLAGGARLVGYAEPGKGISHAHYPAHLRALLKLRVWGSGNPLLIFRYRISSIFFNDVSQVIFLYQAIFLDGKLWEFFILVYSFQFIVFRVWIYFAGKKNQRLEGVFTCGACVIALRMVMSIRQGVSVWVFEMVGIEARIHASGNL